MTLKLKVGARISLTHNIDAVDGLVNGAMGEVLGFTHHPDNSVQFVMVKFDNAESGMERRKEYNVSKFPDCTAIDRLQFEFQLRKAGTATGTAINFPLRLGWGTTLHRLQGHTIEAPKKLVLNLQCWLQPAMIYVGLSRVKFLDQLYILNLLPIDKIVPFADAFDEMTRLKTIDISLPVPKNANKFEIVSLNTISLPAHFEDIKSDINLISAKVLLLQETSINPNINVGNMYNINGKTVHFTSQGHRKGLASYFPPDFQVVNEISFDEFQMMTIANSHMQITNVYRSSKAGSDFLDYFDRFLADILDKSKMQIIMGDWNFCQRDEPNHPVKKSLDRHNYISALNPHQPTHVMGRCLDAIFTRNFVLNFNASVKVCIYSDHEPISIKFDYD
jgi:exonuclease III